MANLDYLINQFRQEWRAGKDARVQLECHAGHAWLSLHLHVQYPPPPQHQPVHRSKVRAKYPMTIWYLLDTI